MHLIRIPAAARIGRRRLKSLVSCILPPRCLLCDGPGDGLDLCAACRQALPANAVCCVHCALPLAYPAARCGACMRRKPAWDRAWAPYRYAWPLDRLAARLKFSGQLAAGRALGQLWADHPLPSHPQWLLPVPLHRTRLRRRGYNQALELARMLARRHGIALRHDVLQRVRATSAQSDLDAVARRRNVRGAFELRGSLDGIDHVALVDDVMTTGATLSECARVLRRAGVGRIEAWALARTP